MASKISLTLRLHQCGVNHCSAWDCRRSNMGLVVRTHRRWQQIDSMMLFLSTSHQKYQTHNHVWYIFLSLDEDAKWEQRCGHHVLSFFNEKKDDHQILEPSSTTFILTASFFAITKLSFNPTDLNTTENHITCLLSLKWFCRQPPAGCSCHGYVSGLLF